MPSRPYFVLDGNICALQAAKDHVNVFLYDGAIVPDPEGIITGGHDNKTARRVAIRDGQTINAPALTAVFRQIIADNRAGGWRKRKRATCPDPRAGTGGAPPPHRSARYEPANAEHRQSAVPLRSAGRRAVIWALAGHLSSPGMAYWMVACSVYLYIAILGANARFCRDEVRRDHHRVSGRQGHAMRTRLPAMPHDT